MQPYKKKPKLFSEQVEKLKEHGLNVPDSIHAEFYLSQINYYRFSAYCLPFEKDHASHQFKENTYFDDILNLYVFDREFRLLLLDAIERIEVSLRTQMAYHLSHIHGTAHPHLKPELFLDNSKYNTSIAKLSYEVKSSREKFIEHLNDKYEETLPPIWAVVEVMTMGQLSNWYSNIKTRSDRNKIASIYNVDEVILSSFGKHLSKVRNYCAHHARLWNRDFTFTIKIPKKGEEILVDSFYSADRNSRKIYNSLVLIGYLMDIISPGNHWKKRLIELIDSHDVDVSQMGFPPNWKGQKIWVNQ
ncbi:MAG: Abi family protein [Methylococcaceae bacterium]|nr:Abi family protein [Methylococcaceae bacterium]